MVGSKRTGGLPIAVFDVSSSSVGGAHVLVSPSDKEQAATILATARVDSPLQEEIDMKRFVSDTVKNLQTVAAHLHKADLHKPHHIAIALASPWYVSQTRTIVYKSETPFLCTRKFFNKLIDEEIAQIVKHELERFGNFGSEGTVVEKQISLVRLNGYTTGDPIGKHASMIEIFLTITVVPKPVIDQFTDALKRFYGARKVSITTSPYATFVVARDFLAHDSDAIIIDVGEEVTDVAFVKTGFFLYQHSFPVGTYGLYRSLMTASKQTPQEVEALVEGYRLGKLSQTAAAKVEKALGEFSAQWQRAFQEILNEGHFGFCLPDMCYITADGRFEEIFPSIVAADPFIQHTCSRGSVTPVFVNGAILKPFVSSLDESLDIPLATTALFLARQLS